MDNLKEALKWYGGLSIGPDEYDGSVYYGALAHAALQGKKIPKHRVTYWDEAVLELKPEDILIDDEEPNQDDIILKKELEEIVAPQAETEGN